MKRVSYKVAKAIKELGYPQDIEYWKFLEDSTYWYDQDGMLERKGFIAEYIDESKLIFAPTYLEVWLWLWREKGYRIREEITNITIYDNSEIGYSVRLDNLTNDPEEAIEQAIEYLCDNNLIK